jgi:transketolase
MDNFASIRDAFGRALVKLGEKNEKVVVLDADVSTSTRTAFFQNKFPDRFFNFGVAEGNMMDVAAGLALVGKIPFASTFSSLASLRALEQIRTSIAYPKLNVKIAGGYGGLSDFKDGPTHHSICDLAIIRSIPNMTLIVPADAIETEKAVYTVAQYIGPVYLRLSRAEVPVIFDENYKMEIGKGNLLRDGTDMTFIATGIMVARVLKATKILEKEEKISVRVVEIHTLKPLDVDIVIRAAEETGAIVTAEEHSVIGGLAGAVAEVIAENKPIPMERIGIKDTFTESGQYNDLLEKYGMGIKHIIDAAKKVIKRKK